MPTSRRFVVLRRAIATLRIQFLPDPFDSLGQYPDTARVQAHTRAFLVLSHAEVESYVEEWAKEIARAAEGVWKASARVTEPMTFLLCSSAERIGIPAKVGLGGDSRQRLAAMATKRFQRYYKSISDNHGVREGNMLALFAPLGVPTSALGTTLLPNLDSFGSRRGLHAHSAAKAVQSVLDPETEYKRALALLEDVAGFDLWLAGYKRRIR